MLTYDSWLNNWRYFCNICSRFENVIQFVDDKVDSNGVFINGGTFSNEFAMILLSTSVEFENVSKQLCEHFEIGFNTQTSNIVQITDCILTHCPNIGSAEVSLPHIVLRPLENWNLNTATNRVDGLEWWDKYNNVKHQRYTNFQDANMKNCIYALASLLIIELYSAQELDNISTSKKARYELSVHPCQYFSFEYMRDLYLLNPRSLP